MNRALLAGVWLLVTLDCALMGYRLAMGRVAVLDKRRYHLRVSARAALLGQVPLAAVSLLAVLLVERGGPSTGSVDEAMARFLVVGGAYAALILGTWALCALPSLSVRTAASVVVFGPFTLLRPLVVVATVAYAVGAEPSAELVAIAVLVGVPGVLVEPLLDRRIARRVLAVGS